MIEDGQQILKNHRTSLNSSGEIIQLAMFHFLRPPMNMDSPHSQQLLIVIRNLNMNLYLSVLAMNKVILNQYETVIIVVQ